MAQKHCELSLITTQFKCKPLS